MKKQNKIVKFLIEYGVYIVLLLISAFFIIRGYSSNYSRDESDAPDYVVEIKENTNQDADAQIKNIYVISQKTDSESEISKNVGFSLLASAIAAFILDTSIKTKQNKKDKIDKTRLLSDLKYECEDILSEVTVAFSFCYEIDEQKRTYMQWIEELFDEKNMCEKNKSEIRYFIQKIKDVRKCAIKTRDNCKFFYNNREVDEELEKILKGIISKCYTIENWSNSIKHHDFLLNTFDSLKYDILSAFPDLKTAFEEEYNYEDLSEWG